MLKGYNKIFGQHALKLIVARGVDCPDCHSMMGSYEVQHSLKKQVMPSIPVRIKFGQENVNSDSYVIPALNALGVDSYGI